MTSEQQPRVAPERLVLAADADRREIERNLHDGTHQSLVALATTLQLARLAAKSDPTAVGALLDELERDVRQALDETALLAQRIYPSTLELDGLAALLRSVAAQAGIKATVDVAVGARYSPELAMTVYLCWLASLASAKNETQVAITVREVEGALTFELAGGGSAAELERLQDRVEALGGRLTSELGPGGVTRLSGSLPLRR
ncbi:MAG TPA: histidine kinase [Gaiellaceae bacterium]|nr:histidine kinase [Gaiellaceae bacterium]